jgi:phosphatidyl-myo-inositol alpha-mannosyltransferase
MGRSRTSPCQPIRCWRFGPSSSGRYDVAHLHEPVAPLLCWDALGFARLPLVGTYHTYSENLLTNGAAGWVLGGRRRMRRLRVRIAVSEAAAWTARRFYGGEYRIIPNGVTLPPISTVPSRPAAHGSDKRLRIVCVAQPVPRKGLPVLLSAFRSLRERIPATLTLIGASTEDAGALIADLRGVRALGKVSDEAKRAELRAADVLCAPSLYGESFGMVLTEAFAEATPVVASDIPGYRDVARAGTDGLLVPAGDAGALADALTWLHLNDERRQAMAVAARRRAEDFAWPHAASEIITAYENALDIPAPQSLPARVAAARHTSRGRRPAPLPPRAPSPQPAPSRG